MPLINTIGAASARGFGFFAGALPSASSVEYLVVAGGGGGGVFGGGGAGGFRTASGFSVTKNTAYTVTVGAGGPSAYDYPTVYDSDCNGLNSVFATITALGGGAGATRYTGNGGGDSGLNQTTWMGADGGSGGGSGGNYQAWYEFVDGGAGTSGQGNDGGANNGWSCSASGGGGGAGAAAADAGASPTAGGAGLSSSISGSSVTYAGGGGGGSYCSGAAAGGAGGGGAAGNPATAGSVNTGGGGGGAYHLGSAAAGGSGIVIIRYSNAFKKATTTGSPTYADSGGYHIFTFTGSGTITF